MTNSYINLITKPKLKESDSKIDVSKKPDLKKQLVTFSASLDSSENIYEALRNFIDNNVKDLETKTELLDTITFCEADSADLESTLIKLKIAIDNFTISESLDNNLTYKEGKCKMVDKDFLITESDVNKTVKDNCYCKRSELDPVRCFVILDKNNKPMLNKGGIIITNTPDADEQIQMRADELYRLIPNAKSIYLIEDEAYDKCVDIRDQKEYVKFVKSNGELIKPSKNLDIFKTSDLDDTDFLINIDEMFE